jgi:hypothetical protein
MMKYQISRIYIFIAITSASFIFSDFAHSSSTKSLDCKSNLDNWSPTYRKKSTGSKTISKRCERAGSAKADCTSTLNFVDDAFVAYNDFINTECGKINEEAKKIPEQINEKDKNELDNALSTADGAISGIQTIVAKTDEIITKTLSQTEKTNIPGLKKSPEAAKHANLIKQLEKTQADGKKDPNNLKNFPLTVDQVEKTTTKDSVISGQTLAAVQSFEFVKKLIASKENFSGTLTQLENQRAQLAEARKGLNTAKDDTTTSPTSGGGGFDPSSLLSLAPLAAMLAQKPPSTPMEDPSGSGITPATPPERAPTASLVKGEKSGESKKAPLETPTNSSPEITPSPYADAFTGAEDSESDITKGSNTSGGGGSPSAGASGSGGGGGLGGSDNSETKGRSTAALPANADEALQSFNSGGGLNYAGGGNPSGATDAPTDDSMKDMLNEMEAAVEDGFDSNLGEGSTSQGSEIAAEDSDSLFPRVRACHIRALKKGMVLNGLGEKLSELDE